MTKKVTPNANAADFLAARSIKRQKGQAAKQQVLNEVRKGLHESALLAAKGETGVNAAREVAAETIILLYQGLADGVFTRPEVSALIGSEYGFATKKDGKPGKTPKGIGKAILDRAVRLADGVSFVNGEEPSRFYEPLTPEAAEVVLSALKAGHVGPWQAYNDLGDIRKEVADTTPLELNPSRLEKLAEAIGTGESLAAIARSDSLIDAYATLRDAIATLSAALAEVMSDNPVVDEDTEATEAAETEAENA